MKNPWTLLVSVLVMLSMPTLNAHAQKSEKLAVGYGSISTNYLPLWIAKEAGIFVPPRYYHLFEERNRFVRYIEETEEGISVLRPTKFSRRDPSKWGKN